MSRTILLADDSVTIRKVVELTFSDTDIRVETVGSGREAVQRLSAVNPDLVLADVDTPELSGYDVCAAVKQSDRPVPVLLLTGTFEPFDDRRAADCGADGHVVKPFESGALLEMVESLLSRPAPVEPAAPQPAAEPAEVEEVLDDVAAAGEPEEEPAEPVAAGDSGVPLSPEQLEMVTRAVVERLSDDVVRQIAWEVVPDLAETMIRERLRQIEKEATKTQD